jgi:hypothetical protein
MFSSHNLSPTLARASAQLGRDCQVLGLNGAAELTAPIAIAALTPLACGPTGPGMAQVSGKVTYKGKPVPKGTIAFVSTNPGRRNATAEIQPDGSYKLQTENPGDGALLGEYNVTIFAHDDAVLDYIPPKPIPPKILTAVKYEKPGTSGLKATVQSGSNNLNFDLADDSAAAAAATPSP